MNRRKISVAEQQTHNVEKKKPNKPSIESETEAKARRTHTLEANQNYTKMPDVISLNSASFGMEPLPPVEWEFDHPNPHDHTAKRESKRGRISKSGARESLVHRQSIDERKHSKAFQNPYEENDQEIDWADIDFDDSYPGEYEAYPFEHQTEHYELEGSVEEESVKRSDSDIWDFDADDMFIQPTVQKKRQTYKEEEVLEEDLEDPMERALRGLDRPSATSTELDVGSEGSINILDREELIEEYKKLTKEQEWLKRNSYVMQSKIADHFRNKMVGKALLPSVTAQIDAQYKEKLKVYDQLKTRYNEVNSRINREIKAMKKIQEENNAEFEEEFNLMIEKELEIAPGLIRSQTGKELSLKVVERFVRRQQNKMAQIAAIRLSYIKIRNMVAELEEEINALNDLGKGFRLGDYETLYAENSVNTDKIEERDEELDNLRMKCITTTQILAHYREKVHSLEENIGQATNTLTYMSEKVLVRRIAVIKLRLEKKKMRKEIDKLKVKAGLLLKKNLMRDFCECIEKVESLKLQLMEIKNCYNHERKLLMSRNTTSKKKRKPSNKEFCECTPTISLHSTLHSAIRSYPFAEQLIRRTPELIQSKQHLSLEHLNA